MPEIPDILRRILARKREEVAERAARRPLAEIAARCESAPEPRGFRRSIERAIDAGRAAVIAEIKHRSPSRGVLRDPFDPPAIAAAYQRAGAAALSVLTDREFFGGDEAHLAAARDACSLPALRKDFLIDPWQVYEARALGADCILLIVAALGDAALDELAGLARHLGMDVLVEVHDAAELERASRLDAGLLGINNRDLRTFETRTATTLELLPAVPDGRTVVTESGIHTRDDVAAMRAAGIHAFLVGEAFMRAPDPGRALEALFDPADAD